MKGIRVIDISDPSSAYPASTTFNTLVEDADVIVFSEFLAQDELQNIVHTIYDQRQLWTPAYGGEQFSFGQVWYSYQETGRESEYFQLAEESNLLLENHLPGLYGKILDFIRSVQQNEPVTIRDKWAGPGLVIFPAHGHCAEAGGDAHFDWAGLTQDQLNDHYAEAYSFIAMIQKPEKGGGLRVWGLRYKPGDEVDPDTPSPDEESILLDYQVGDMVVIDSFKMHAIQSFEGNTDRISLTFHIAKEHGIWHVWF